MNMISTGAFRNEMDATSNTKLIVNRLVSAWEKKNSKVGKAGGVSLMALSLAACGGDSEDIYTQAEYDAAITSNDASITTAATTAALTGADGTVYSTVDAAVTSNDASVTAAATTAALTASDGTIYADVDAAYTAGSGQSNSDAVTAALTGSDGTVHASVDAAVTSNDATVEAAATAAAESTLMAGVSGFDTIAALEAAYNAAIAATPVVSEGLTTSDDNIFGTAGDDEITATATTYTSGDIITDGTSTDADTLTVTTTTDISAVPVVSGIENIVFELTSVGGGTTGADTFTVDVENITASTVTGTASNGSTIVTTFDVDNVGTNMTVSSSIATINVAAVADADVTVAGTGATQTVVQSGTADTLTVTGGNLTVSSTTAEEGITINATGTVTMNETAANAAGTDVAVVITAGDDVTITDISDTGSLNITASGGDVVVGATDLAIDGAVTVVTAAGDITVTDADDSAAALTLTAVGAGPTDTSTASDGAIIVTSADAATSAVMTSTDSITITSLAAATDVTLSAAANSGITDVDAIVNLTLSSTSTAATPIEYSMTSTDGRTLETVTFTGDNDVTFNMAAADLVAAAGASQALVATDSGSGTSRIALTTNAAGAGLDMSGAAVDEIEVAFDQGTDALTFASGANVVVSADQTDLTMTAAAVAGNDLNVTLDSGTVGTGITLTDLSVTNVATLDITMADDATATQTITDMGVGASTAVTISGNGALAFGAIGTAQVASSVNASGVTGDITANVVMAGAFTAGSGDDTLNISDAVSTTRIIDGGDGADSVVFAASDDFSAASLTLSNIETLNVAAAGITLSGAQVSGKGYNIVGDNTADDLAVNASAGTGETIDLSGSEIVLAAVTITGGAGADILSGSATAGTIIVGGDGADTITGGAGADTITGGAGIDTIDLGTGGAGDDVNFGAAATLIAANRDTIENFVAGATNSDTVSITAATVTNSQLTPAGATAASEYVTSTVAQVATAVTYDVSGVFDADAAFVLELGAMSSFADLSASTTGSEVVKGLASTASAATSITFAETNATADTSFYVVAYDNDNAYLYYADDDDDDNEIAAGEMTLIATFTDVEVGAFTADNFIV